jgi:hypothetical protein
MLYIYGFWVTEFRFEGGGIGGGILSVLECVGSGGYYLYVYTRPSGQIV